MLIQRGSYTANIVPPASSAQRGILRLATNDEAAAGALTDVAVSPRAIRDEIAALAQGNKRQTFADASGVIDVLTSFAAVTALTAPRTLTLPAASAYPPGALYVGDESGACGDVLPITIAAAAGDTIAGQPSYGMASPYQKLVLHSNGAHLWTFA